MPYEKAKRIPNDLDHPYTCSHCEKPVWGPWAYQTSSGTYCSTTCKGHREGFSK